MSLLTTIIANNNPELKIIEVPYKGAPDATIGMLGGHTDASMDWLSSSASILGNPGVKIIGITGKKPMNGYPIFQGSENLVADNFLFVPKTIDPQVRQELHQIFNAANDSSVNKFCETDFGNVVKSDLKSLDPMFKENKDKWKRLTVGIIPQ
jgi:tripartite-type tricarboxylate transporter receptor subunit TctC